MSENEEKQRKCCMVCTKYNPIPQRYIVAVMGCLAIVNCYLMRQCLAPTITQLVKPRNYSSEQMEQHAVCEPDPDMDHKPATSHGDFDWDQKTQGIILSAFYYGYVITHIPGGLLADTFGSKWVLCLGILSSATFTFITPWAINLGGAPALIALRVLMGAGEGTTFPALSVLMADWILPGERGFLGSLIMGGGQMGSILSNSITGVMLAEWQWEVVFRVWSLIAISWFLVFVCICYSSPFKHPCIKDEEKNRIQEEIGDTSSKRRKLPPTPFKRIFSGMPMWALISAQIGHDWAFYILIAYLPKYMNDVLQMKILKSGVYSSLPSLVMWICSLTSGIVADILIRKKLMKITNVRKMMTGIAAFGPAVFIMAASYSRCNRLAVIANFCIAMGLMGAYYGGMKLMPVDMSPNYAGILMAITNGIGSLTGAITPIIVGWLTPDTTIQEWERVFWLAFAVLVVTGIVYCIWADCEIQPWNEPDKQEEGKGK